MSRFRTRWELTIYKAHTSEVVRTQIFTTKERAFSYAIKRQISSFEVRPVRVELPEVTWEEVPLPGFEPVA